MLLLFLADSHWLIQTAKPCLSIAKYIDLDAQACTPACLKVAWPAWTLCFEKVTYLVLHTRYKNASIAGFFRIYGTHLVFVSIFLLKKKMHIKNCFGGIKKCYTITLKIERYGIFCTFALVAQWIRRRSPKPKIGGSSPPEGNQFCLKPAVAFIK